MQDGEPATVLCNPEQISITVGAATGDVAIDQTVLAQYRSAHVEAIRCDIGKRPGVQTAHLAAGRQLEQPRPCTVEESNHSTVGRGDSDMRIIDMVGI